MEFTNIIKTDIVNSQYDALWEDISEVVKDAPPRPVLVIVNSCGPGSTENTQLLKMLGACNLAPEQYNIIRLKKDEQVAWHRLREWLDPKIIFLIGVSPVQLGISAFFMLNVPNNFNDRVWLPTVDINELEQHKEVKGYLWNNGMKPVFIDKKYGAI